MERIDSWDRFVSSAGAFADAARPLDAMRAAGFQIGGPVAEAFTGASSPRALNPAVLERLKQAYGPTTTTRLHIDRRNPRVAQLRPGRFSGTMAINLAIANNVLTELYNARTFPQEVPAGDTEKVITLQELRQLCIGVPADAEARLGGMQLTAPHIVRSGPNGTLQLDAAIRLPVAGPQPAALTAVAHTQIRLELVVDDRRIMLSIPALDGARVTLDIDPGSAIRARPGGAKALLQDKLQRVVKAVLLMLRGALSLPAEFALPGNFGNTSVAAIEAGAVTRSDGADSVLIAGFNLVHEAPVHPAALASEQAPAAPSNIRIAIDEKFANDALAKLIESGDLSRLIDERVQSAVAPIEAPHILVNGGEVSFNNGSIAVSLDCAAFNACPLNKDLGFKATTSGRPQIFEGKLTLGEPVVDINLDNTDAVVCTVLSGMLGPLAIIVRTTALAVVAAINPTLPEKDRPVTRQPGPLPGTEKELRVELLQATTDDGTLFANGLAQVVPDTEHMFVYVRVLATSPVPLAGSGPVADATVHLIELDRPAPAGDDTVIPAEGESEHMIGRLIITETRTYQPRADEALGTAKTDATGLARFAVKPNRVGGQFIRTQTKTDAFTHEVISTSTQRKTIVEPRPDLAVTIVNKAGTALVARKLIALNVQGNHAGTLDNPIIVEVAAQTSFVAGATGAT